MLLKDLKVKGAGQTLKQARSSARSGWTDDPEEIDCRHDDQSVRSCAPSSCASVDQGFQSWMLKVSAADSGPARSGRACCAACEGSGRHRSALRLSRWC
ncbi:PhnA domain-containing protein [Agrobacterium tumefaciens]|uniref:PhnA domain-containing protein n=1 Tax=Agrobacterium tumefaciens TaxID=358 RepID=UPI0039774CC7